MRKFFKSKTFFLLCIVIACVITDQVLKIVTTNKNFSVLGELLCISYTQNTGAAFSMLSGKLAFFIAITIVFTAILLIFFAFTKHKHSTLVWGVGLICGGAIGNLIDRIAFGFVKDFIAISFFPAIFNFADICITIGTILLIVFILFYYKKEEKVGNKNI